MDPSLLHPSSEIGYFEKAFVLVEKQILWLEISMEDAVTVAVSHALTKLIEEALDQAWRQRPRIHTLTMRINELLQIGVQVFKNQVQI